MKIYWIHNVVYYPTLMDNRWIKGTINGILLDLRQYTLEEVKSHKGIKEANGLADLILQWEGKVEQVMEG